MTERKNRSLITRENVLFVLGIAIIVFEVINAEAFDRPFHYEFLIAGLALCGVSITQLGDRGSK